MAIIVKKGSIGTLSGKIGTVVVTTWKDIDVARGVPIKFTKKQEKPKLKQQLRLGIVTHFMSPFRDFIKIGFDKKANKNPGFQTAVEYNLKHALVGESPDYHINYSKAIFSRGPLDMAWGTKMEVIDFETVQVSWEAAPTSKIRLTGQDIVCLMLYSEQKQRVLYLGKKTFTRADFKREAKFGHFYYGNTLHGYLFFVSPDGKSASNTRYLGTVQLPEKEAAKIADQPALPA